jgi:hypothetical protein
MKKPVSFIIFTIALIASLTLVLPALFTADMLLAMLLSVVLFLDMILAIIGFYLGLKFKSDDPKSISFNKIGTFGNMCVFIVIIILLFLALV